VDDGFRFKDSDAMIDTNQTFPSIILKSESGTFDYCLKAKIVTVSNVSKLELTPSNCNTESGVVCKSKPLTCDPKLATDSNGALKLQMDPAYVNTKETLTLPKRKIMKELFQRLDKTKAFETLFRIMWYSNLPCSDIFGITSETPFETSLIKACYWKGKPINCAAIFSPIPTDRGMCCAFNMKAMNEIFNGKSYVDLAMDLQAFDRQSTFMDSTVPDWFKKNKFSQPGLRSTF